MSDHQRFKTARCILWSGERVLLAVHQSYMPLSRPRWGLPGGRIERGETAEQAARREVAEELGIALGDLTDCGDFRYKGASHRVFGTRFDGDVVSFDDEEIVRIGWHTLADVAALHRDGGLHAGFEYEAIHAFLRRTTA